MIAVPGVGMIVSGIFNTDAGDPPSTTEILHSRASGIAFTMLILAAVTSSRTQRSDLQPARFTRLTTLLPVVAAAAGGAGVALHDTRWTGLGPTPALHRSAGLAAADRTPTPGPSVAGEVLGTPEFSDDESLARHLRSNVGGGTRPPSRSPRWRQRLTVVRSSPEPARPPRRPPPPPRAEYNCGWCLVGVAAAGAEARLGGDGHGGRGTRSGP